MARNLKITQTDSSGQIHDRYTGPEVINGAYVGGTGGLTSQTGRQIQPTVKVGTNGATTGSILAQKGAHKFRVTDGTNTGTCTLVNLATPTAASTMSIAVTLNTITEANIVAANVAGGATVTYVNYSTANIAGPNALKVGATLLGFTGNASTATITAINATVGALANVTVSIAGNVAAQNYANITNTVYASRITNRYVSDFGSDGSLSDSIAGGYNPNKYRYHLATPDSTFVQVAYA
jgi:hypothetical protein